MPSVSESYREYMERAVEEYGHPLRPGDIIKVKEIDPYGIDQHTAGAKLDQGKPDLSLLLMFGQALSEVGHVATVGADKYSRGGWQSVPEGIDRYTAAMLRHLFEEHYESRDSDTDLLHAAQVAWNALARLELMLREKKNEADEG